MQIFSMNIYLGIYSYRMILCNFVSFQLSAHIQPEQRKYKYHQTL